MAIFLFCCHVLQLWKICWITSEIHCPFALCYFRALWTLAKGCPINITHLYKLNAKKRTCGLCSWFQEIACTNWSQERYEHHGSLVLGWIVTPLEMMGCWSLQEIVQAAPVLSVSFLIFLSTHIFYIPASSGL